ncbi:MAG: redoxin family protein [Flammeovirgaceae bacterium]|nr:redoxin family protein [Flammeovirgaceae bacterium]
MKFSLLILLLSFIAINSNAQLIQDFKLINVVSGQEISLSSYPSCAGAVIIFTSNNCPFDGYYTNRIKELSNSYGDKVPVLLVNSSPDPAESVSVMTGKAKQSAMSIPYLADKDQKLMLALNATKTPEAFLLQKNGNNYAVIYRGAIDDNAQVESDAIKSYLKEAIEKLINDQKIEVSEIRPIGCSIRKKQ